MKDNVVMRPSTCKRRLANPTSESLKKYSKKRRRKENFSVAKLIHGASSEDENPVLLGLIDTISAKFHVETVAKKLFKCKPKLTKALKEEAALQAALQSKSEFESSEENLLRSLIVYYSHNVFGKERYIKMRRASKSKNLPNFVDYPKLSKHMRDISIGEVNDISDFTKDVHEDEIGAGLYRPLKDYALRLAEYYLRVNKTREDKLREFPNFDKKTSHFHSIIFSLHFSQANA